MEYSSIPGMAGDNYSAGGVAICNQGNRLSRFQGTGAIDGYDFSYSCNPDAVKRNQQFCVKFLALDHSAVIRFDPGNSVRLTLIKQRI